MAKYKAFYAYPDERHDLKEDIRNAVENINASQNINITTWEELAIGGKYIINGILEAIDKCDLFMCDLTYLNYNVLYELGYALSKEKKIWITLNTTHPQASINYQTFSLMSTIGYAGYENSQELKNKFFSELPHEKNSNIFKYKHRESGTLERNIVYLECEKSTTPSINVKSILNKSGIPIKIDDPYEGSQPLSWYYSVLQNAFGAVIHFHTEESQVRDPIPAGRKALIAGLAKGLQKNTLLLAHDPYKPPLDYHNEIKVHTTAKQCEKEINEWLEPIMELHKEHVEDYMGYVQDQKALDKISNIFLGDYVAENESHDLVEYFFETAEYHEALKAQQVLFIGRKGTGKTANLIKIKDQLSFDKRNFIVPIQPQGHEFEGVLRVLNNLKRDSEHAHLIESVWEHLIYTEIAKQYFDYLESLPLHYIKNKDEDEFMEYVSRNKRLINADFTLRFENIVGNLISSVKETDTTEQQRLKVSEFLHDNMIKYLRTHLGKILEKREKVIILIDNLDKSWGDNADLKNLSGLLFGLLNVIHKISDEFRRNTYQHRPVNLSLIVFLRSDIFSRITSYASEVDKVPITHLKWTDFNMLFQVIEKRITYSRDGISSPDLFWESYFCKEIYGVPLRKYVEHLILPRPRDIIFLFKSALQEAVNHGHSKVMEDDFKAAEFAYSDYAIRSLFAENGGRIKEIDNVFYAFAGEKPILTREEIEICVKKYSAQNIDKIIEVLCEMTFLGQETSKGKFEFYFNRRDNKIIDVLAEKLVDGDLSIKEYKINKAFHVHLGIKDD